MLAGYIPEGAIKAVMIDDKRLPDRISLTVNLAVVNRCGVGLSDSYFASHLLIFSSFDCDYWRKKNVALLGISQNSVTPYLSHMS